LLTQAPPSHVTKHTEGGRKHRQTNVWTRGFAGETIQPDCEMDMPVTYVDVNGTEKFDIVLGDIQTNEKFNYHRPGFKHHRGLSTRH
jgi:hypothetical protein